MFNYVPLSLSQASQATAVFQNWYERTTDGLTDSILEESTDASEIFQVGKHFELVSWAHVVSRIHTRARLRSSESG